MAESSPSIVTLNVGGRKSVVLRATLIDCPPLYVQTGEKWKDHVQADGSYFVDADPDIFAHVLNFLRRPTAYPIFWTKAKGFDYDLYNKVEKEAEAWLVTDLANWIKEKSYESTIVVLAHRPIVEDLANSETNAFAGSSDIEQHVVTKTRQMYICPRGIAFHRIQKGEGKKCGLHCMKAQGNNPDEYEDETYKEVTTLRTSIRFNLA